MSRIACVRRRPSCSAYVASPSCETLERRVLLSSVVAVGSQFLVNGYTTADQAAPSIAADAHGNFVVVWVSEGQDGSGYGVFGRRFNAAGAPQGGEFQVNTYTTSFQLQASVAMDADGDFVVAWSSYGQGGAYPWSTDVYAQRYDASGTPQGDEFRVNTYTTFGQFFPVVAMNALGDFVVVWTSAGADGSSTGIFAQRFNASGAPQGIEFQVNTFTLGPQGGNNNPSSVAMDADGNFVVAWADYGQSPTSGDIHAQRFDSAGVPQGDEFRVNTFTTNGQIHPAVAMSSSGEFVVSWSSNGQDGSGWGVYAQRYDSMGVPQEDEFRVNTFTTNAQRASSVAIDADGDFVITWNSFLQDGSGYGVYAQRYDASGAPRGEEFRVNTFTSGSQLGGNLAISPAGDHIIAWSGPGVGDSFGVFAQRYAVVPQVISSDFIYEVSPHRLLFQFNRDVGASLDAGDLLIENLTTGQTLPAAEFSLAYDVLSNLATVTYANAGVLPDANYRATLLGGGISTPHGATLATDHTFDFFFLNGDANRDGRVNLVDFNILAANFGQSGPQIDFTKGDFNYDGVVNLADFNILAARFGTIVTQPARLALRSLAFPSAGFLWSVGNRGISDTLAGDPLAEMIA